MPVSLVRVERLLSRYEKILLREFRAREQIRSQGWDCDAELAMLKIERAGLVRKIADGVEVV
ncbi:hypothetical protein ES703_66190 [subsurface metagenome]